MKREFVEEQSYIHFLPDMQREIILHHCSAMEETITHAPGKEAAQKLVDEKCSQFNKECQSDIIRHAMRNHLDALILKRWK